MKQPCKADQLPDVESVMLDAGAVSVTYTDSQDQPLYEPGPGETPIWDEVTLIALFPSKISKEKLESELTDKLSSFSLASCLLSLVEDQDWERAWMVDFKPMAFGKNSFWICPAGMKPDNAGGVVMSLDPGLAFGSGTHPTTSLCLEWLAVNKPEGLSLVDYGCGSGVLGIAALLLKAEIVYGVDNDPQALLASLENCEKNNIDSKKFSLFLPGDFAQSISAGDVRQVDIVMANILASPLVELSEYLSALVKPEGQILLSGILEKQSDKVLNAYEAWFEFNEPEINGDWVRLDGKRKNSN